MDNKYLFPILGTILLIMGTTVGVLLVRQNQENRPDAAVSDGLASMQLSPESITNLTSGDVATISVDMDTTTGSPLIIGGASAKISFTHAANSPVTITSVTPNSELTGNQWQYSFYSATSSATLTTITITATDTSIGGYSLSQPTNFATFKVEARNPGTVNMQFDETESQIILKSTGEDILGLPDTNTGTYSVLDTCSNVNPDLGSCQNTNLTGGTACSQDGNTLYCCPEGQQPNGDGTACVDELSTCGSTNSTSGTCANTPVTDGSSTACDQSGTTLYCCAAGFEPAPDGSTCQAIPTSCTDADINPNTCTNTPQDGTYTVCRDDQGTDQYCCPSGQQVNPETGSCEVIPTCGSSSTNSGACSQTNITGSELCVSSGSTQYCCQEGFEPNADNTACVETITSASVTINYRLEGITNATYREGTSVPVTLDLVGPTTISMTKASPNVNSTGLHTATFTKADNGGADIPAGTYTVCLDAQSHLRKCFGTETLILGSNTIEFPSDIDSAETALMLAGDTDADNDIDFNDQIGVNSQLNDFLITNPTDEYDINQDGVLNITDLAIILLNIHSTPKLGD